MPELRLRLLGVGAMRSPRYAPAGLLVGYRGERPPFGELGEDGRGYRLRRAA